MSSSRVHTTLTGPSTCLAMRTAATTMSGSSLRPKPPPSRCWLTVTFSTGSPAALAASDCTRVMICVPVQISQASGLHVHGGVQRLHRGVREERQLERSPRSLSPLASPLAMSPTDFATTPSFCAGLAQIVPDRPFELIFAFGPSFHSILSASRPFFAAHMWSPTRRRASSSTTTLPHARESSSRRGHRPCRPCRRTPGNCAIAANFMSGRIASMP